MFYFTSHEYLSPYFQCFKHGISSYKINVRWASFDLGVFGEIKGDFCGNKVLKFVYFSKGQIDFLLLLNYNSVKFEALEIYDRERVGIQSLQ